ncbi:dentin sialophosphoprotein-like isoform X2 [Stegodyphus dumicola]|uniref:dentin sialophosphoprotein-like isoform X2 n=1 Tax=Stegodyphus dumicola TaxID=202533 RepID=UPI0015B1D6F4|nr:dentin sialophosphoprotein-like isoform X2 [Stegodyphus dumicola]
MAAAFGDDSTDDEIGAKLQLAERLRINRGENSSDRKEQNSKDLKQYCNYRRKKTHSRNDRSSSSSSAEMAAASGSSHKHSNKKRQSERNTENIYTKRTCFGGRYLPTPLWCDEMKFNKCGYWPSKQAELRLCPDKTYEDNVNNQADSEDSDLETRIHNKRFQKPDHSSRTLKNNPCNSSSEPGMSRENPATVSNSVKFIDSGSDDDSKITMQNGALKGGRQSPDLFYFNRKVLGRKIKKVLDSDDSDEDSWHIGYRSRPRVFSSSDSEDSKLTNGKKKSLDAIPASNADQTFFCGDSRQNNKHYETLQSSKISHFRGYGNESRKLSSASSSKNQNKGLSKKSHNTHSGCRSNLPSTSVSVDPYGPSNSTASTSRRGRSCANGIERSSRRSGSPHPKSLRSHQRISCSKGRPPSSTRSRKDKLNLAASYPDLFDAEDSSEVEFFTANSYSDTETSAEACDSRKANESCKNHPDPLVAVFNESVSDSSSEDEISVVFSTTTARNNEQRRGVPRAIDRLHGRGTSRGQPTVVSFSPDPVEQVRQVEEDERIARILQAQFDAEMGPQFSSVHANPRMGLHVSVDSHEEVIDPFGESDSEEPFNPYVMAPSRRGYRVPHLFSRSRTSSIDRSDDEEAFLPYIMATPRRGSGVGRSSSRPGTPNAFLSVADLNGEAVSHGLHKAQINRLPTRRYVSPNSAAAGFTTEVVHKRVDLNKECQVCLSDYETGDILRILPCFHEFHTPCIDPWLKINHTCPVCRVIVNLEN